MALDTSLSTRRMALASGTKRPNRQRNSQVRRSFTMSFAPSTQQRGNWRTLLRALFCIQRMPVQMFRADSSLSHRR